MNSRFQDFFKTREPLLEAPFEIGNEDDLSKLTVWDFILAKSKEEAWYDIESLIKDWATQTYRLKQMLQVVNEMASHGQIEVRLLHAYTHFLSSSTLEILRFLISKNFFDKSHFSIDDLYSILLSELHRFESVFCEYLSSTIDEVYYRKANYWLWRLLVDGWTFDEFRSIENAVLDFNYTKPYNEQFAEYPISAFVNIHGSLDKSNIVFGIDAKRHMDDANVIPFTKTYRLLSLDDPDTGKLVHMAASWGPDDSTDVIKFYGHSLSEADYSYFQSIFDGVNLYSGHTRLVFYYKPWFIGGAKKERCTDEVAQKDMFDKVTRLVTEYGKTMNNKDHGENLMHRLLLEGRLSVKECGPETFTRHEYNKWLAE